ncbi:MAG: porin family protein [Rhodospirillaceae bacterium]|nr:porin family protein [Rhodospirillaceae bacterium]
MIRTWTAACAGIFSLYALGSAANAAGLYDFNYFLNQPHPFAASPRAQGAQTAPNSVAPSTSPASRAAPLIKTTASNTNAVPGAQTRSTTEIPTNTNGSGIYFSASLVGGYSTIHDPEVTNITGLQERRDEDWVGGNSLAVGYDWSRHGIPIRSEFEFFLRYRFDLDYRGTAGGALQGYMNEIGTYGGMVNGYYDLPYQWRKFKPYLGAGVGIARHWSQAVRRDLSSVAFTRVSQDSRNNELSWALMAGFHYLWKTNWHFRMEGRYQDLGKVENGPFGNGDTITADYATTDLVLGITYRY